MRRTSSRRSEAWAPSVADTRSVVVRYFAAAADAAGCTNESVGLPTGSVVGELSSLLIERHGDDLARVLKVSAFLIGDELTRDPNAPLGDGVDRVDVLPPFAGG